MCGNVFLVCFILLIKMKNRKPCVLKHVEAKLFYILFNIYRFTKKKENFYTHIFKVLIKNTRGIGIVKEYTRFELELLEVQIF